MYLINRDANEIDLLSEKRFAELGFTERNHLQEWLVKCPTALGEDLLIIQKEFDGFDQTNERLDLLALDKQGNLVLIENKLDDSGRDVVWQALKYASYCSSLKKSDITRIYQAYLDRYERGENAEERICDFLDIEDISDVIINSGTDQRIKFVAAKFRREVTSTILWLLQYGLSIECFKATAYQHDVDLFLKFEQIIPTPEATDFMIGITEKEKEERTVERSRSNAAVKRQAFWEQVLARMNEEGHDRFQNLSPSRDSYIGVGSGLGHVAYNMVLSRADIRVEFYMKRSSKEENKLVFDYLHSKREEIEERFGKPLTWQRLNDKKACRIKCSEKFDYQNQEEWPQIIDWLAEHYNKIEKAFSPCIDSLRDELKNYNPL